MGPLQIALIAVNIIVPLIIWRSNHHENNQPIEFKKLEATLTKIISANGGYTCPAAEIVKDLSKLCVQSDDKWKETSTAVIEQVEGNTLVSCEVRDDGVAISISPDSSDNNPSCRARDTGGVLSRNPAFLIEFKGTLHSISFDADGGERQFVPAANCREKLKRAKTISAATLEDFESQLGQDMNDPADSATGNHICVVYGTSAGWHVWRKKFRLIRAAAP
jgi:hypothetical protein